MDLNPEQRKLVEAEPNGHALLRGVAGSGKTAVALHRALFLRQNYCEETDRILLVTFGNTLILIFTRFPYVFVLKRIEGVEDLV